jgi:hypothetical protein
MQFLRVGEPPSQYTPPPPCAEFPEIVQFVRVGEEEKRRGVYRECPKEAHPKRSVVGDSGAFPIHRNSLVDKVRELRRVPILNEREPAVDRRSRAGIARSSNRAHWTLDRA